MVNGAPWRNAGICVPIERFFLMSDPVEALARELWEAHGVQHEMLTRLAAEPWEALDPWMQNHWRMLARTAIAFIAGSGDAGSVAP